MPEPSPSRPPIGSLAIIAIVVAAGAGAFAYTAGWLSPTRLTPTKIVDSLAPPGGPSLGHRRNHAKGICFTGVFESNGNGAELSSGHCHIVERRTREFCVPNIFKRPRLPRATCS